MDNINQSDLPETMACVAEIIGVDNCMKLIKSFGGELIYFYKPSTISKIARNKKIRKEFKGANYKELSDRYQLTVRQINYIVNGN